MWGGSQPSPNHIEQLADICIEEWTRAVCHMLRHWETPTAALVNGSWAWKEESAKKP
jgi:hypothetical protein